MNPLDERVAVPIDDPNADTEWNDILRKHGIIPEKPPSPTPLIEEALVKARELAHENRLEGKDLEELDELEDDEDEEFLNKYRQKRVAELSAINKSSVYNQVYPVQKVDWSRDVTESSNKAYVLVLLTSSYETNVESRIMIEIWRELARKFGDIKFCQIRADLCIEGYPEKNTPTVLVYRNGDIVKQLVTLRELGGVRTKAEDVEKLLVQIGALKSDDIRVTRRRSSEDQGAADDRHKATIRPSKKAQHANDDEDSDWD